MYVSFCLVMRPLIWLLTFFWVFGAVLIAFLKAGALFASIIISLVTIALAWIAYRPKLCGSIVVLLVLGSIDSKYYCDYLNVFCDLK